MPSYSIKGGDKAMIRNIVGRFHVGQTEAEVADAVVAKLKVYAPAHVISAVKRYAAQVHRANRKLYGRVTGGINPRHRKNPRTIDITPKWTGLVRWFIRVLEDQSAAENAKKVIREELMRLAKFADEANVKAKSRTLFNRRHRGK